MHRITISVLSVFVILPAFASAKLPVVNIASGGVSARDAFGESIAEPVKKVASTRKKQIVARTAKAQTQPKTADVGSEIIATNDVLVPRRPSADLWAKNDVALRMPNPNEFSVYRTDTLLPEERIDQTRASVETVMPVETVSVNNTVSEMDTQIARLVDLQRRAEESVRNVSPRVIAAPVTANKSERVAAADTIPVSNSVSLRRMVVDMESDDVITRRVEQNTSSRVASVRDDMANMTPNELRQAFRKTFLSENKHLSTYPTSNRFDEASDMSYGVGNFSAKADLSESKDIRPMEIKIKFREDDSALSRANYNLLTEFASIVVSKPTRAVQVAIPQYMTQNSDIKKIAARRLAIIEQVLVDNGVAKQRIVPMLSNRKESGLVLRILSSDQYDTITEQNRDIFGDAIGKKTYKSMSW